MFLLIKKGNGFLNTIDTVAEELMLLKCGVGEDS